MTANPVEAQATVRARRSRRGWVFVAWAMVVALVLSPIAATIALYIRLI